MKNIFLLMNYMKKFSNKLKFNKDPKFVPPRPNEVKYSTCSADKSRELLGYKTTFSLDQSITKVIDFIKKKGVKKFRYEYELEIISENTPDTWKSKNLLVCINKMFN
jgi:UDP-glucose 4-epimerase